MIKRARTAAAKQQVGGDGEMGGEEEYDEWRKGHARDSN
jgi:hypothetical protein